MASQHALKKKRERHDESVSIFLWTAELSSPSEQQGWNLWLTPEAFTVISKNVISCNDTGMQHIFENHPCDPPFSFFCVSARPANLTMASSPQSAPCRDPDSFFPFCSFVSSTSCDVFTCTGPEWFNLLAHALKGGSSDDRLVTLGTCFFTFSLLSAQSLSAFHFGDGAQRIYFRQTGPIFGAHEGFLWTMRWFPTHQPTIREGSGEGFFSILSLAKSFHCISGKSWKSRPDSSDSKNCLWHLWHFPVAPVSASTCGQFEARTGIWVWGEHGRTYFHHDIVPRAARKYSARDLARHIVMICDLSVDFSRLIQLISVRWSELSQSDFIVFLLTRCQRHVYTFTRQTSNIWASFTLTHLKFHSRHILKVQKQIFCSD